MKKKILFLLDDSRVSGVTTHTLELYDYLKKNFECKIYLPKENSSDLLKLKKTEKKNYEFIKIEKFSKKINDILKYIFSFTQNSFNLLKKINSNNFNYIIIQGSSQFFSLFVTKFINKNIIIIIHDAYSNFLIRFFLKIGLSSNIKIVFVSKRSQKFYSKISKKYSNKVIYNGLEIKKKKILIKKKKKKYLIGTVCNINPEKNLELLVETAKFLKNSIFEFVILGPVYKSQYSYFKNIKKKIKKYNLKNIKFLGYSKNVNRFINKLDLYFCFSKTESSPFAVIQAISNSLPLVSTNVGDFEFLNNKYKFAYIDKSFNPKRISKNILNILLNRGNYKRLRKNSNIVAKKYFDKDRNFKNYLSLLN